MHKPMPEKGGSFMLEVYFDKDDDEVGNASDSLEKKLRKTREKTGAMGFLSSVQEIRMFEITRPADTYDFLSFVR